MYISLECLSAPQEDDAIAYSLAKLAFNLTTVAPPSRAICAFVIYADAGEHRNRAKPAISVGAPTRPTHEIVRLKVRASLCTIKMG